MKQPDTIIELIERDRLPEKARELSGQGYRLVQMMGTARKDDIEILVSFDKAYDLKNYRMLVPRSDLTLPSITGSILGALSYENELQDLFGIKVTDLAIDYEGKFLRTKITHPMSEMAPPPPAKKAAKKAARKAEDGDKKTEDGKTIKTVSVKGVKCETADDIDNPKVDDDQKKPNPENN